MSDIVFSGDYIERHSALRNDPAALETALTDASTGYVAIWRNRCLIHDSRIALLTPENVSNHTQNPERITFLGKRKHRSIFALSIDADTEPGLGKDMDFIGLRDISARLSGPDAALAAYARAIVAWQNNHRHCGVCGTRNFLLDGGFVMVCADRTCGHRSFPRLDPAVIVLVHKGDRALLGRQTKWPDKRFSTIAGFVEPGESLNDAVRREVEEETNIRVGDTTYVASQPWPFPAALMIGFHACGLSEDIRLNDGELVEARWVTRQNIESREVILPPRISVAYHLIETWFDLHDGPTLSELDLPEPPLRVPRPVDRSN